MQKIIRTVEDAEEWVRAWKRFDAIKRTTPQSQGEGDGSGAWREQTDMSVSGDRRAILRLVGK